MYSVEEKYNIINVSLLSVSIILRLKFSVEEKENIINVSLLFSVKFREKMISENDELFVICITHHFLRSFFS